MIIGAKISCQRMQAGIVLSHVDTDIQVSISVKTVFACELCTCII